MFAAQYRVLILQVRVKWHKGLKKKREEKTRQERANNKIFKRKNKLTKTFGAKFNVYKVSDYLFTAQVAAVWFRSLTPLPFKIQAGKTSIMKG